MNSTPQGMDSIIRAERLSRAETFPFREGNDQFHHERWDGGGYPMARGRAIRFRPPHVSRRRLRRPRHAKVYRRLSPRHGEGRPASGTGKQFDPALAKRSWRPKAASGHREGISRQLEDAVPS
jgi:hypothetical protein